MISTIVNVNGQIETIYDLTTNVNRLIIEVRQVHHLVIATQKPISFANLFSLPHLHVRKTRGK
jgi:hypothetical protein